MTRLFVLLFFCILLEGENGLQNADMYLDYKKTDTKFPLQPKRLMLSQGNKAYACHAMREKARKETSSTRKEIMLFSFLHCLIRCEFIWLLRSSLEEHRDHYGYGRTSHLLPHPWHPRWARPSCTSVHMCRDSAESRPSRLWCQSDSGGP